MNCVWPNFQKDFPARGGWFLPGKVRQNHKSRVVYIGQAPHFPSTPWFTPAGEHRLVNRRWWGSIEGKGI